MNSGILSKILNWVEHPTFSEGTPVEWMAGLVFVLLASFLWATVVRATVEGAEI